MDCTGRPRDRRTAYRPTRCDSAHPAAARISHTFCVGVKGPATAHTCVLLLYVPVGHDCAVPTVPPPALQRTGIHHDQRISGARVRFHVPPIRPFVLSMRVHVGEKHIEGVRKNGRPHRCGRTGSGTTLRRRTTATKKQDILNTTLRLTHRNNFLFALNFILSLVFGNRSGHKSVEQFTAPRDNQDHIGNSLS